MSPLTFDEFGPPEARELLDRHPMAHCLIALKMLERQIDDAEAQILAAYSGFRQRGRRRRVSANCEQARAEIRRRLNLLGMVYRATESERAS